MKMSTNKLSICSLFALAAIVIVLAVLLKKRKTEKFSFMKTEVAPAEEKDVEKPMKVKVKGRRADAKTHSVLAATGAEVDANVVVGTQTE